MHYYHITYHIIYIICHIANNDMMGSEQLYSFFMENNSDADEQRVARRAALYIEECAFEEVNSDVAYVQMCLETGFLSFQGLVNEEMNNICGLDNKTIVRYLHMLQETGLLLRYKSDIL